MQKLANFLVFPMEFFEWWLIKKPKHIFKVIIRILSILNNQLSLTINLKLLFVPLYGDYTIVGRIVGFVFRVLSIISGLLVFLTILIVSIVFPIIWLILPFIFSYELNNNFLIILSAYIIYWYLQTSKKPKLKTFYNKKNIYNSFTTETIKILNKITPDLKKDLEICINNNLIKRLLLRTELIKPDLLEKFPKEIKKTKRIIAEEAFNLAKSLGNKYVEIEHLFFILLKDTENINTILSTYNSNLDTIRETIRWVVREREKMEEIYVWQEDYILPPAGGIGKGLTGRVTPILDSFSEDYTKQVKLGYIKPIIGREKEIKELANLLRSDKDNILLIGKAGSGKTSIVKGIAYEIMVGTSLQSLKNKRIVSINLGKLLAKNSENDNTALKLTKAMEEIKGSKDIILFIDEIEDLIQGNNINIYSILEPYLNSPFIQFIGATSLEDYRKYIEPNSSFSRMFQILEIEESNENDTIEILKSITKDMERKYGVTITYPAIKATFQLSKKLIHERVFPDKAIDILSRSVTEEKDKVITANDIASQISKLTHVPVDRISNDETNKLLNIENLMKKMVIGQDNAIKQISEAIKRARVGIRNENRPIASFLFVGSTGVGKTQTAKAVAYSYFGDKNNMIRIDMSEYQQINSMNKLIGDPTEQTKGILTEQVKNKPFSLILLDEIEKAHPNILLTFLQVLDDARLTDSTGVTTDFSNTIIIATSNVGTREIQEVFSTGGDIETMKNKALEKVREKFAPEFLNRFNDIIVFNPLSRENIEKITKLLLDNVIQMANAKGIEITFNKELIKELINRGYSPEWGARPMEREISNSIENYLANKILTKELNSGDKLELGLEVYK